MSNLNTIFLSHSSQDKEIVDSVRSQLDPANTFYDTKSMEPGEPTLQAMKDAIQNTSIFVLFHSPNSNTTWVNFEKSLMEIHSIENKNIKILVCTINGSTYSSLPKWMSKYFTTNEDYKTNDIVRTIKNLHSKYLIETNRELIRNHPGREALHRQINLDIIQASVTTGQPINVLILWGVQGMGRGTLSKELVESTFRQMRSAGPIFEIPANGDAVDWYLQFYTDLNYPVTNETIEKQIFFFTQLNDEEKADALIACLQHWASLNQVITLRHRWGLRNKGNSIPFWFKSVLTKLRNMPEIKLIVISERQLPRAEIESLQNIKQFHLEELDDLSIQTILTERINARFMDYQRLPELAHNIKGHPATANYAAYLINSGLSMESLKIAPDAVLAFQDKILHEIYEKDALSTIQKSLLRLLSILPRLSLSLICEAFNEYSEKEIVEELWELVDFALVDQSQGGKYKIPAVVASTYRRKHTNDDTIIVSKIANILKKQFDNDTLDFELIESFLMITISNDDIDISNKIISTLTPAKIEIVAENLYFAGQSSHGEDMRSNYSRCHKLAKLAMKMAGSDHSLENILFYGADSSVRLGQKPDDLLKVMREKGFSAAAYVEASYLFHANKNIDHAINILKGTLKSSNYRLRNVRLLTRIYLRSGKFPEALDALNTIPDNRLLRDTGLVVMKMKAYKGTRNYAAADKLMQGLQNLHDDYGELLIYKASAALKERDFPTALSHVNNAKNNAPRANKAILMFLECACKIEQHDFSMVKETVSLAQSVNRENDAYQLLARQALAIKDWKNSEYYIGKIINKDWFDLNVEYRMLEEKLKDPEIKRDVKVNKETTDKINSLLLILARSLEGTRLN